MTPRITPLFLVLIGLSLSATVRAANFNIPAQPAIDALQLFIKQSGHEVIFPFDELKDVRANAVVGRFEPQPALDHLLQHTGFGARQSSGKQFVVARMAVAMGVVEGVVRSAQTGSPVAGARVGLTGTSRVTRTAPDGRFSLKDVPAGEHELEISAEGMQPTQVADITLRGGRRLMLGPISIPALKEGVNKMDPYLVSAKKNDGVVKLDPYAVEGRREKPFISNMDIPRTINDAQPYYIFDSKTIDQSGAVNVEDFLKQRLTMNASIQSRDQISGTNPSGVGNASSINLRGLGDDKTLILIDGRRRPGINLLSDSYQPDLNGIPMSAIDRIEVLPSSASGIYGGSAIGGVINVVLKRNYAGGEVRLTYDNTWDSDAPRRTVSASYGFTLEGGRTQVMLNASWSDGADLLLQDRRGIFEQNLATILKNSPAAIYTATSPFLGALPNIAPSSAAQTMLTLKNGVVIPTRNTHIAAGTSAATAPAELHASLAANAGSWSLDLPTSTQQPTGLFRLLGTTPEATAFQAGVRRKMSSKLELFADFTYTTNESELVFNSAGTLTVSAASPVNPFTTSVAVKMPDASRLLYLSEIANRSSTVGAIMALPGEWTAELDYSWSNSRIRHQSTGVDTSAVNAAILSGVLNPFVDTLRFPLGLEKYPSIGYTYGSSVLKDISLRGSGPLRSLRWGTPSLTFGLGRVIATSPVSYSLTQPSITTTGRQYLAFPYGRRQVTDSAYGELTLPLAKKDWLPLVHVMDLQLSGRIDRYTVNTGSGATLQIGSGEMPYNGPTLNGQPYFSKAKYDSTNGTVGLKYQPVPDLTLRTSVATAFLPPSQELLIKNPEPSTTTTSISDPMTGQTGVPVYTLSGGNPDLKPQSSLSWNAGVIWEPRWQPLQGLRLNAEYYRIEQEDAIGSLNAQTMVSLESTFPDRVTRNAAGTITVVDISVVNLYKRETEGWDLSADYTLKTGAGTFNLRGAESIILHLKNQYSATLPMSDAVNYPSESGAAKYKGNGTLTWSLRNWTAGWNARYFSSYRQNGSVGGPNATQRAATGATDAARAPSTTYTARQGGDTIPSQIYHDAFVGYIFGKRMVEGVTPLGRLGDSLFSGVGVQVGVKNIFDRTPPFDAFYPNSFYVSPYGDLRLRTYTLTVKKMF